MARGLKTLRNGMRAAAAIATLGGGLLGGCTTVSQADYDEAVTENNELRDRIRTLQGAVERCEDDKQMLRDQVASADSRAREAEAARPPAGSDPGAGSAAAMTGMPGATLRGGDVVLTVAGDVLFESGQVTLKASGRSQLDQIARLILSQYSGNIVRVEGYTDSDPIRKSKWKSNEQLSSERALAVERHLVSRGVDADQVYSAAMGPANPKSTKKASRRVEIVILQGG